jgi:hypothetical protein
VASRVTWRRELRAIRKNPAVSDENGPIVCISDPFSIDSAPFSGAARDALSGIEDCAVVASAGRGIVEETRAMSIEDFPDCPRGESGDEGCGAASDHTTTENVEARTRILVVGDATIRCGRRASAHDGHPKPAVRNRRLERERKAPVCGPAAG